VSVRRRSAARPVANRDDFVSLEERSHHLLWLRSAFALAPVLTWLLAPEEVRMPLSVVMVAAIAYATLSCFASLLERRSERSAAPIVSGMLLVDGIYLAVMVSLSGGATSDLRFLAFGHVVAVTLLLSYRSGLKVALWDTILFLLVVYAAPFGVLGAERTATSGADERAAISTVVALWLAALGTAAFAALSERELRRQKVDLERLAETVEAIQTAASPARIADILLEELRTTFGATRGAVLASPRATLDVLAATDQVPGDTDLIAMEPLAYRARSDRVVIAVRRIDPETDPTTSALLPGATNVLFVPMLIGPGEGVGLVIVEFAAGERGIRRWVVAMIEQFVSHAALALHGSWLMEERQARIEEIQRLQADLEAQNADLELRVLERTAELRAAIARLQETDDQRRRLLDHVVRAGEEERLRIASDIHDDPVQKLVALKMRLELLAKANPTIGEIPPARDAVLGCIQSLRHLLFDLRPPVLDQRGLAAALRSFLENAEVSFRWSVHDELTHQPPAQARLILYRIAQEVLTNARKHAQASHVTVRLTDGHGGVRMEIADDGIGFEPQDALVAAPGHMGLAAIRERAEMAGGRCGLHSLPGQGTSFDVWIPTQSDPETTLTIPDDLVTLVPTPEAPGVNGAKQPGAL
jgi:signal transduction histidine kinase